jgi:hypothetical protein
LSLQRPESTGVTSDEADKDALQEESLTASKSSTSSIFRKRDKKLGYSQAAAKPPILSASSVMTTNTHISSSIQSEIPLPASVLPTQLLKPVYAPRRNDFIPQSIESTNLQHKTFPPCTSSKPKKSAVLKSAERMTETSLSPDVAYSEINEASLPQQHVNTVQRSKRGKRCGKSSSSSCATTAASVSGSGES